MSGQAEIDLHREQIAKKSALLDELETSNNAGSDLFSETQAEKIASKPSSNVPTVGRLTKKTIREEVR
jgi:hypothetical protein